MVFPLKILVYSSLLLLNSAEGPVNGRGGGLEGIVTAVALDLSSQNVYFKLAPPSSQFWTKPPRQTDSLDFLSHSCANCDWQKQIRINDTQIMVVDKHSLFIFTPTGYRTTVMIPLLDCNVTSSAHEPSQQSVIVLCDHSHSDLKLKLVRYNYSSGVLSEVWLATGKSLGRGALFEFPLEGTGDVITHVLFPLLDQPWFLQVYDTVTKFPKVVEVYPVECFAVQEVTVVKSASEDFLLIHCSTTVDSNKISLLVVADLVNGDFPVYFDLQTAGIEYDPYTAVVRSSLISRYCIIALQDSPLIIVLDLIAASFRTLELTGVARDAILVDDDRLVYNGAGGLHWVFLGQLFSNDGTVHLPELISSSTTTCFPPACPRLQAINHSHFISTKEYSGASSFVVYTFTGDGVQLEGEVEIGIEPLWYLPFDGVEPVNPNPTTSSPVESTVAPPSISVTSPLVEPTVALPLNDPLEVIVASSICVVVFLGIFIALVFFIVGATTWCKRTVNNPTQVDQDRELPDSVLVFDRQGNFYPALNHQR